MLGRLMTVASAMEMVSGYQTKPSMPLRKPLVNQGSSSIRSIWPPVNMSMTTTMTFSPSLE